MSCGHDDSTINIVMGIIIIIIIFLSKAISTVNFIIPIYICNTATFISQH